MPSAARKPQHTDDPPETAPALAVAPKTRQRHDPTAKAQAALDRADARLKALVVEIGKHQTAIDAANSQLRAAQQHRDYLAMHPLLVVQDESSPQDAGEPAADAEADLSSP